MGRSTHEFESAACGKPSALQTPKHLDGLLVIGRWSRCSPEILYRPPSHKQATFFPRTETSA